MPEIKHTTTAHDFWEFEPSSQNDLDEKVYRAVPAINASAIAMGIRDAGNPDPYAVKLSFESSSEATDAMARGTLAHTLLLEPEKLDHKYAIWHGKRRAGAEWDAFEHENKGRVILKQDDYNEVLAGCLKLRSVSVFRDLLDRPGIEREVSLFSKWQSLYTKGRLDTGILRKESPLILDLKTTDAGISDRDIETTTRRMKYREKLTFYQRMMADILDIEPSDIPVYLVFVKLSPPYGINIKKLTFDCYQFGWSRCEEVLKSVERCVLTDEWPVWTSNGFLGLSSFEADDIEMGELA